MGLSSIACISAPAIPKEAPTANAVKATGSRKVQTITSFERGARLGVNRAVKTSVILSHDGPVMMSKMKKKKTALPVAATAIFFLLVIWEYIWCPV
jgi:hypothetical protein